MGGAAESRLTQLHKGTHGLAWWRDRAVPDANPHPGPPPLATGPVSRRANSAPSHRADEPPGPQAPGKQARLVHADRTDRSGRGARMQCPPGAGASAESSQWAVGPSLNQLITAPNVYNTVSGVAPREVPFRAIDLGEVALRPHPT